jgi:hypothetical protein
MSVKRFKNKLGWKRNLMNKKGSLGLIAAIVVLGLVILAYVLIDVSLWECHNNRDCQGNAYCGSDHECHEYPSQVMVNNNYMGTAFVFGLFIFVSVFFYRTGRIPLWDKIKKFKRKKRRIETEDGYIEV